MAFPNFELQAASSGVQFPKNLIRATFESYWETRVAFTGDDEYRKTKLLVAYVDVNTLSTASTSYDSFIDQQDVDDPIIRLSSGDSSRAITFTGTWQIQRCSANDNANGTSRVTLSLKQLGDWVDFNGDAV
jgi:hypothetical protein